MPVCEDECPFFSFMGLSFQFLYQRSHHAFQVRHGRFQLRETFFGGSSLAHLRVPVGDDYVTLYCKYRYCLTNTQKANNGVLIQLLALY